MEVGKTELSEALMEKRNGPKSRSQFDKVCRKLPQQLGAFRQLIKLAADKKDSVFDVLTTRKIPFPFFHPHFVAFPYKTLRHLENTEGSISSLIC